MLIRKYRPDDRFAVEQIHFETGFLGKSMAPFLSNNNLWKQMISYYLDKEPESSFVLEDKGKIYGYLLGCVDDKKSHNNFKELFNFIMRRIRSLFLPKKDRKFWKSQMTYLFKIIIGSSKDLKLKKPNHAGHFHINLLPEARGKSYGTKMLKAFEKQAKSKGIKFIHAESFQREVYCAKNFWTKNNFKESDRVISKHWETQLPNETIYLVCNVKKI
jgi:GNAT superfamily N-acetyltransferase